MSPATTRIPKRFRALRKMRFWLAHQRTCWISAWIFATIIAFAITAFKGTPAPAVHDEFAYLLGADTFAAGKVTNPTHPMWQHFESFHVIQQPTYTCKYPPLQPLTLALGQKLGHPIIGACLATGVAIGALVWMLTGWLPRKWYWAIWLFAVLHPGLHLFWGQSYWGGAVPLTGASLLIGALGRLSSRFEIHVSVIAAIGVLLLANSRPFEGAVLTACVGLALIWKLIRIHEWQLGAFFTRVLAPGIGVLGLGVTLMLSYNVSVTGHALTMPYKVHEAAYGWTPLFLWQQPGAKPEYRHPVMEHFYVDDKLQMEAKFPGSSEIVSNKLQVACSMLWFFCSELMFVALLGIPFLLFKSKFRLAIMLLIPVFVAALATPWAWPHYFAPSLPLLLLLLIGGIQQTWKLLAFKPMLRVAMAVVVPVLYVTWSSGIVAFNLNTAQHDWAKQRVAVKERLISESGKDLVIVRYSNDHNPNHEWVYNDAEIDASEVVWARELPGQNSDALIEYFSDRKVWVVEADLDSVEPQELPSRLLKQTEPLVLNK